MTKKEIQAEQARLEAVYTAARASGDMDAAVAASAALSTFISQYNPPKGNGSTSRAGQRQAAERRAMYGAAWRKSGWKG